MPLPPAQARARGTVSGTPPLPLRAPPAASRLNELQGHPTCGRAQPELGHRIGRVAPRPEACLDRPALGGCERPRRLQEHRRGDGKGTPDEPAAAKAPALIATRRHGRSLTYPALGLRNG